MPQINPLKMKPSEATKLLNSTPSGQVMGERQASRHLLKAGYRISGDPDGKTIHIMKYAAWLLDELESNQPKSSFSSPSDHYEAMKEAARSRNADASRLGRDIGDLPEIKDPARKESCRLDFKRFCEHYFQELFYFGWSQDHIKAIRRIETTILKGGLFALAMPRGSGKTTLTEVAVIWAILYGHKKFIAFIGATEEASQENLASIKTSIETNELLQDDFPEVCYPIEKLDGIANRCNGQLYHGKRTRIRWKDAEIILPTVEGSEASGAIVKVAGITGRVRGMKYKRPDGKNVRPDVVIIDDPQTRESAASVKQCKDRIRILSGDVLGLAGPGKKISGIMPCTVINPDDAADQILDQNRHPDWNGERCKLCYQFPSNTVLWEKYAEIRSESLRKYNDIREATAFYRKNRREMDAGAVAAWAERHDPDELSAIQNIMNLKIKDEAAFFAEYQNEPLPEEEESVKQLETAEILQQLNGLKQNEIPIEASKITMFVDVMDHALYYALVAWSDDFTGSIVDYGTFPKQKKREFTVRNIPVTLQKVYPDMNQEGYLFTGLRDLLDNDFLKREYQRQDGAIMRISRVMIDANWGQARDVVYLFCRRSEYSSIIYPSHGKYIGPAGKSMREYNKKPGDKIGLNWMIPKSKGKGDILHVLFDTNYWKSYVRLRLQTKFGNRGSLTLWGRDPKKHTDFAEQMVAEFSTQTEGRGRTVDEWKLRPKFTENHWFDCLVGCSVAAAIEGIILPGTIEKPKKRIIKITKPPLR